MAPGSMYSLISSSALCCNMFDSWRGRPLGDLGISLGIDPAYEVHRFESKHPTGLPGKAPNLDVELQADGLKPVAIESKFVETYRPARNSFQPSYFSERASWRGLESWRRTALAIEQGQLAFTTLHAAQLIKHVLGLSRRYGPDGFVLLYLWYRIPGLAGDSHQLELDRFRNEVGGPVDLRVATYQGLFGRLVDVPSPWAIYLLNRYGLAGAQLPP